MKIKSQFLPGVYLLLGLAALGLYRWILAASLDGAGLIMPNTLPEILLWCLTALACVGAFLVTRGGKFGAAEGLLPGVGNLLFALGVFSLSFSATKGPDVLVRLYVLFSYVTAAALVVTAVFSFLKKKPPFLLTVAPCVLCVLHLVECYQLWSEVPQLLEYVMGTGAVLCLNLFAYHRMAYAAGLPLLPRHYAFGLMGIFFCCAAIPLGIFTPFFACGACWMAAELTALCREG